MTKTKMKNKIVLLEDVFKLGEKYNMEIPDIIGLKKVLIIGTIAVEKCVMLGLGGELREEVKKRANGL